jgi:hypothetical protein
MDEFAFLRLFGGLSGGVDLAAIVAFIAFGIVYFLAPVVGYRTDRRGALAAALYLLVTYAAVGVIQLFVQYILLVDTGAPRPGGRDGFHFMFIFAIVKLVIFAVAMAMFAAGLQNLRLRSSAPRDEVP